MLPHRSTWVSLLIISSYELVSKANSKLGLLMRTCHFTMDKKQKITFYLTIVRSTFALNIALLYGILKVETKLPNLKLSNKEQ